MLLQWIIWFFIVILFGIWLAVSDRWNKSPDIFNVILIYLGFILSFAVAMYLLPSIQNENLEILAYMGFSSFSAILVAFVYHMFTKLLDKIRDNKKE